MRTERKKSRPRGPAKIAEVSVDLEALMEPLFISDLTGVHGRSDRLRVTVNGTAFGDLTLDYVADQAIRVGRAITRDDVRALLDAVRRTRVLDKALDLLAVQSRSSRDLKIRLRRAGAADGDIGWAVDRLVGQRFVDDAAYARQVARAKVLSGGVSRRKVVTALRRKGVSAETADEAIDATLSEVDLDEEGAAMAAAEKRVRALASLDPAKRKQRLYAFLARRGFESDVIRRVMAAVLR